MKNHMKLTLFLSLVLGLVVGPSSSRSQSLDTPQVVAGQTATLLPDGRWLILGGEGPTGPLAAAAIWDPLSSTLAPLATELRHPRAWHTATLLPDGTILIVGGLGASTQVVETVELFDSDMQTFEPLPSSGLTPRARHTATLVTDGRVLIVGGSSATGEALATAELWDFRSHVSEPVPAHLQSARYGHTATLLPNGAVLVWGGLDRDGTVLHHGELYDLQLQRFLFTETVPFSPDTDIPQLAGSQPEDGATHVPVDSLVALRFSTPLRVDTLNVTTVTLSGPDGVVPASIVGAEEGRLMFVTPELPLEPGATYTLTLNGATDPANFLFPLTSIQFMTAQDQAAETGVATLDSGGGTVRPGSATAAPIGPLELSLAPAQGVVIRGSAITFTVSMTAQGAGSGRVELAVTGLPTGVSATFSPHAIAGGQSAMLVIRAEAAAAAATTWFTVTGTGQAGLASTSGTLTVLEEGRTALIGRVVDTDRQPLAGVAILVGGRQAFTDASGNFLLLDPPVGDQVILIDGDPASHPDRHYPTIPVSMTIMAGRANELPYLPHLHVQRNVNFTRIDPSRETVATDPDLPGVVLRIPPGTSIIGWDGRPAEKVSIRTVPIDRLPVRPPPPTVRARTVYMFYFGKRGGGIPSRPVPFEAPNDLGLAPGDKAELWYFDESPTPGEAPNDWRIAGLGTVSDDGTRIRTDPGVGIPKFCCGAAAWNPYRGQGQAGGPTSQPGQGAQGGDPVDLVNGVFMFTKTDLVLTGLLPIAITRTYRSGDPQAGPFGIGTTLGFDDALQFPSADVITYVYRGNARTQFIRQPDGSFTNTTIPAFQGASIVVNPDGTRTLRVRDGTALVFSGSLLIQVRDRVGNTVTILRQMETNPTTLQEPSGLALQLSWVSLARDRVTSVTDPLGRTVTYTYDTLNRLVAVTDPAGGITQYAYDAAHRMTALTDARGITFLQNAYDVNSRVCRQIQADAGTFLFYYITADRATLPESQQLLAEAAAGGPITQAPCTGVASSAPVTATVLVDPRGTPTTYWFNGQSFLTSVTDALGQRTTYTRDGATNQLLSATDPLGRQTAVTYDPLGNVTSVTRLAGTPGAVTTALAYESTFSQRTSVTDPLGHMTTYSYDGTGNLTAVSDPLGQPTTLTYNAAGQPLTVTDAAGATSQFAYDGGTLVGVTDPLGNTATRFTDSAGRLVSLTTPLGQHTAYAYDALNRLTQVTDPLNGLTQFGYDPNGNLLTVTDARNNVTTYAYDSMDRLATRTDPLLRAESYLYDPSGNLTSVTDRKSQITSSTYDALNRRTQVTYADGSSASYTYDAGNRLTQLVDSSAGTITRTYDDLDRLTAETTPQGTVSYTYDAAGRRTSMTVAGQPPVTYSYDNANRLTEIMQGAATVSVTYDAAGRRTSLTLPNDLVVHSAYDAASRLTALTYTDGATVLGDLTYTYDAAGNRIQLGGTWARTGQPNAMTGATYDAANQQTAFGSQALTYDLNGNLTGDGTSTYSWNARNQLTGISGLGLSASFVYDGLGRRLRKTINGAVTDVLFDGANPVQELSGATVLATILTGLGIDEYFTRTDAAGTRALLPDALGSTLALADSAGAVQTEYTYEPFGNTSVTGASSTNPFQFTGRENDGTGLYYYRARYYHPTLQRFLSEDPFNLGSARLLKQQNEFSTGICQQLQGRPQELNLYGYVRNDPTALLDPYGLFSIDIGLAVTIGPIDLSLGTTTGLTANLTNPQLGAGGFVCFNICADPPPSPPRKDPSPEAQPITVTVGAGKRAGVSVTTDLCTICINVGFSKGPLVSIGIPVQIR